MATVKRECILLEKTPLYFENGGVMNPAVYQEGTSVHLFYRSMQDGGVSMIGYCRLEGPLRLSYRAEEPIIVPEFAYEAYGVEDPRVVKIDDTLYLTYSAVSEEYVLGALATSKDGVRFVKRGIIVPRMRYERFYALAGRNNVSSRYFDYPEAYLWDKNVTFFPRRIHGKLYFLHRIRPGILITGVEELSELCDLFWETCLKELDRHILLDPLYQHEGFLIGCGCPPVETAAGWLVIYHGVEKSPQGPVYTACAALLDLDNPNKVIARLPDPLFSPQESWECHGNLNNVVFPTGTSFFGGRLYIYYGSGDICVAVASVDLDELLKELHSNQVI